VWYNNDMSRGRPFTVCKFLDEGDACSDSLVPLYILDDHLSYFGVKVSTFGESGCKR
ncbi:Lipase family protein, partial [Aphelenchoides avenae]